jgi:hypothetical protein
MSYRLLYHHGSTKPVIPVIGIADNGRSDENCEDNGQRRVSQHKHQIIHPSALARRRSFRSAALILRSVSALTPVPISPETSLLMFGWLTPDNLAASDCVPASATSSAAVSLMLIISALFFIAYSIAEKIT